MSARLFSGRSKTYPVQIDTGVGQSILMNHLHVRENNLPIFPMDSQYGICCLPNVRVGGLTFRNVVAHYLGHHAETQVLGLPLIRDKDIRLGVSLLQRFNYVAFNTVDKQIEFSMSEEFPGDVTIRWTRYSMSVKKVSQGFSRILIEVPVSGHTLSLILDTGAQAAQMSTCLYIDRYLAMYLRF